MKIGTSKADGMVEVSTLAYGEVFRTSNRTYWMVCGKDQDVVNAINLVSAAVSRFNIHNQVVHMPDAFLDPGEPANA